MLESPHSVRRIRLPNGEQPTGDDHARHQSDCTSEQGSDIRNARADSLPRSTSISPVRIMPMNFVMTAQDADPRQDRITLSGNRFRHIDMVLIDDFQYFAGRTALQEQLLQTLRALHQAGRTARDTQRTVLIGKRASPAVRQTNTEPFRGPEFRTLPKCSLVWLREESSHVS